MSFRNLRVATTAALALLSACSSDGGEAAVAPVLPRTPSIPAHYRGAAFLMDVSATKKTVRITAPAASINVRLNPSLLASGAQYSLLGGDAIELVTSDFQAGAIGAVEPGKVAITFDLQVVNKLSGYTLTTPTFPTPPSGVVGLQVFPFEIVATTSSGGVQSAGNEVVVTSPRFGAVVPSSEWGKPPLGDGNAHNFFNDVGCTAASNDCFRYEPYDPIGPQGASSRQRVGFLIDPTVGDFRVKLIVAADLASDIFDPGTTVAGSVTSNIGPVAGATISVTGGFSGTTNAAGSYSITNVAGGPNKTVSISNLPTGCTANQASFTNQALPIGGTVAVNFVLTCYAVDGALAGTVAKQEDGSPISGVTVVVTPQGGAALAAVTTASNGAFIRRGVPTSPANGTITISGLPSGCVNAGPYTYTGMTSSGLVRDIFVRCPPSGIYPLTATWAVVNTGTTGRQAQLTLAIDMDFSNDPTIDGTDADGLNGIQFELTFDGTKLSAPSALSLFLTKLSPDVLDFALANTNRPSSLTATTIAVVASVSAMIKTGNFQIVRLNYDIAPGVRGTLTPTLLVTDALASTRVINITSNIRINAAAGPGAAVVPLIIP